MYFVNSYGAMRVINGCRDDIFHCTGGLTQPLLKLLLMQWILEDVWKRVDGYISWEDIWDEIRALLIEVFEHFRDIPVDLHDDDLILKIKDAGFRFTVSHMNLDWCEYNCQKGAR